MRTHSKLVSKSILAYHLQHASVVLPVSLEMILWSWSSDGIYTLCLYKWRSDVVWLKFANSGFLGSSESGIMECCQLIWELQYLCLRTVAMWTLNLNFGGFWSPFLIEFKNWQLLDYVVIFILIDTSPLFCCRLVIYAQDWMFIHLFGYGAAHIKLGFCCFQFLFYKKVDTCNSHYSIAVTFSNFLESIILDRIQN